MTQTWEEATKWELDWHGSCVNSLSEELKQLSYARRMGLKFIRDHKTPYNLSLNGANVIDIGGGPYSLLLKRTDSSQSIVVDPCKYPSWIWSRYDAAKIGFIKMKGEDSSLLAIPASMGLPFFDEAWVYNCLQHAEDPEGIIKNAREVAKIVRIFEWIETGVADGHLHNLTEANLNEWLGGTGKVENINENEARGLCYYRIFRGRG